LFVEKPKPPKALDPLKVTVLLPLLGFESEKEPTKLRLRFVNVLLAKKVVEFWAAQVTTTGEVIKVALMELTLAGVQAKVITAALESEADAMRRVKIERERKIESSGQKCNSNRRQIPAQGKFITHHY